MGGNVGLVPEEFIAMKRIRKLLACIDRDIEKVLMFITYMSCGGIIFVEVFRRFLFKVQEPWSTSIPIYLFIWLAWIGLAFNTKMRSHLSFPEVRGRLPYNAQFACLALDTVLWLTFGVIVMYSAWDQVAIMMRIGSVVEGTDNLPLWLAYLAVPVGWAWNMFRVLQNFYFDVKRFMRKEPFVLAGGIIEQA
jgi:TRAP-type C4-dicarboxylate transport system permease small subunit